MNKATVKGSYTVEAALILPCIFFIIIGLLYLGFYVHDKVKIQAIINQTAIKGRALIRNETDMYTGLMDYEAYNHRGILYCFSNDVQEKKDKIYNYACSKFSRGFFIAKVEKIEVSATYTNVKIEVITKMDLPLFNVKQLFANNNSSIQLMNSSEIQNATEFIRIFTVFAGVGDKVEVIDTTLKKLQKVLVKLK